MRVFTYFQMNEFEKELASWQSQLLHTASVMFPLYFYPAEKAGSLVSDGLTWLSRIQFVFGWSSYWSPRLTSSNVPKTAANPANINKFV